MEEYLCLDIYGRISKFGYLWSINEYFCIHFNEFISMNEYPRIDNYLFLDIYGWIAMYGYQCLDIY